MKYTEEQVQILLSALEFIRDVPGLAGMDFTSKKKYMDSCAKIIAKKANEALAEFSQTAKTADHSNAIHGPDDFNRKLVAKYYYHCKRLLKTENSGFNEHKKYELLWLHRLEKIAELNKQVEAVFTSTRLGTK